VKYANGKNAISPAEANYAESHLNKTTPVGSYPPNDLGLYDMAGNVRQWASDWYDEGYYSASPDANPKGPSSGQYRVLRGGSFLTSVYILRATNRSFNLPSYRSEDTGFRCAK
jgi:formylglycine-generating enzyme required for sulfatase activity